MNMYQLFRALPRDLQWEALCDFAGTHAVRKGKLMRKLVLDAKYERIKYMHLICPSISAKYDIYYFYAISVVVMSNGRYLAYGEQPGTGETGYGFRRIPRWDEPWNCDESSIIKLVLFDDSVLLPPFVKHSYPSYPDTDNKKKRSYYR